MLLQDPSMADVPRFLSVALTCHCRGQRVKCGACVAHGLDHCAPSSSGTLSANHQTLCAKEDNGGASPTELLNGRCYASPRPATLTG